ncbi:hypothetical protein [Rhizobium leguminosarum]
MSEPFKGRCGKCEHVFIVAHLPMPLTLAADLMKRAACPSCGSKRPIYVATDAKEPTNV